MWLIEEIAPDFRLLDDWVLPVDGGRGDFGKLVEVVASIDPRSSGSGLSRALFWVRFRLGAWFGWDDPTKVRRIPGSTETSLSSRVPDHLRATAGTPLFGPRRATGGFTTLYRIEDEAAAEISNDTVHGVLHLAWLDRGGGRYQGQLGIYVKPRGALGEVYLKVIQPFRHLIVYPALIRQIERAWEERAA